MRWPKYWSFSFSIIPSKEHPGLISFRMKFLFPNSFYCCYLVTKLCSILLEPYRLQPTRLLCPWNFPVKNTGVDCHFLLPGIFLTQGLNRVSALAGGFFTAEFLESTQYIFTQHYNTFKKLLLSFHYQRRGKLITAQCLFQNCS